MKNAANAAGLYQLRMCSIAQKHHLTKGTLDVAVTIVTRHVYTEAEPEGSVWEGLRELDGVLELHDFFTSIYSGFLSGFILERDICVQTV